MRKILSTLTVALLAAALSWPQGIIITKKKGGGGGGPVTFTTGDHTEIEDTDQNNSITVTVPPNLASGDTWLIVAACDIDTGGVWGSDPSGFTAVGSSYAGDVGYPIVHSWYKTAGASESNATVTTTGTDYDCIAYSIRISASVIDQTGTPFAPAGSSTTIDAPDITVGANDSLAVLVLASNSAGAAATIIEPSGATKIDDRIGANLFPSVAVAVQAVNAGSYAPGNWTLNTALDGRVARTFSFKPTP